jgi:hypothetical protein
MAVAIKNTRKRLAVTLAFKVPDDIELFAGILGQVDVGHELEVFFPVVGFCSDSVHLFSGEYQIWIVRLACTAAVLGIRSSAEKADRKQYK